MASPGTDIASALPIRSEADGVDERVQVKIVDANNPDTQQVRVDTDSNAHVEVHGNRANDAADVVLQLSEEGRPNPRGDYEVAQNSKPASTAVIAHTRGVAVNETSQAQRITAVPGSDNTISMDVAIRDESGQPFTQNNPLPVVMEESEGNEIANYLESPIAAIKDVSENHDYAVTALKTLVIDRIWAAASGKMSIELQIETGVITNIFNTVAVAFNSTANPNIDLPIDRRIVVAAGVRVRIIRTNLDNQAQTLYSTLWGIEKN